ERGPGPAECGGAEEHDDDEDERGALGTGRAAPAEQGFARGDLVSGGAQEEPGQGVEEDARPAPEGGDDKGDPDEDRVDPVAAGDAAADAGDLGLVRGADGAGPPEVAEFGLDVVGARTGHDPIVLGGPAAPSGDRP